MTTVKKGEAITKKIVKEIQPNEIETKNEIDVSNKSKSRKWTFTLNNYTQEDLERLTKIKDTEEVVTFLCFQEEMGKNKTPHLQGFIHLKKQNRMSYVKKVLGTEKVHLEVQKGSDEQNLAYCTKSETKIGETIQTTTPLDLTLKAGRRTDIKNEQAEMIKDIKNGMSMRTIMETHIDYFLKYNKSVKDLFKEFKPKNIHNVLKTEEMYPWEKEILEVFRNRAQHRTIHWIWSQESSTGKTIFKQYIENLINVLDISSFKLVDILHGYETEGELKTDVMWANISRVEKIDAPKLEILEQVSDGGQKQSTKYEGGRKYVNAHTVVTSNHPPPFNELPKRIREYNIDDPKSKIKIEVNKNCISQKKLNEMKELINVEASPKKNTTHIKKNKQIQDLDE